VLLTGDWHAAEDLVQASLVKLYRVWPRLDTRADPDPYLRRIMVNTQRSWWRARWRRETPVARLFEGSGSEGIGGTGIGGTGIGGTGIGGTGIGGTGIGGDDFADRQALGALVRQALAGLPRQQRAVLVLRYCEDLSEAEVAGILGCSPGTGTAYTFTARLTTRGPMHITLSSAGTVDVDTQGRVRQLDATQTLGQTKRTVRVTFGDFGLAVSVSPPPADQTVVPQGMTYIPNPSFTPVPSVSPSPAGSG